MQEKFDSIDMYGASTNAFTIKGHSVLHSYTGISCSLIHLLILFSFGILKLVFVLIRHNPNVSVFDEANRHQTEEEAIDLDKNGF